MLGAPDGYDGVPVYYLYFQLDDDYEQAIDFSTIPEVKKSNYSRPGLLMVYFVLA